MGLWKEIVYWMDAPSIHGWIIPPLRKFLILAILRRIHKLLMNYGGREHALIAYARRMLCLQKSRGSDKNG